MDRESRRNSQVPTRKQDEDAPTQTDDFKPEVYMKMVNDAEDEHGAPMTANGTPSLAVLALRVLHRTGHELAKGEADPAAVAAKAVAGS